MFAAPAAIPHLESSWSLPLTGAVESYSPPVADYPIFSVHKAYHIPADGPTGNTLRLVALSDRWQENKVRLQPAMPGATSHTLHVYPAALAGTLKLHGERKLDMLMGEDDVPAIREDFHDRLPLFAAMRFGGEDEESSVTAGTLTIAWS